MIFPRLFRAHKYKVKTNNSLLEAKLRVYGSCLNISEKMVQFSNQDAILVSVAIFQIKKAQASGIKPWVLLDASRAFGFSCKFAWGLFVANMSKRKNWAYLTKVCVTFVLMYGIKLSLNFKGHFDFNQIGHYLRVKEMKVDYL